MQEETHTKWSIFSCSENVRPLCNSPVCLSSSLKSKNIDHLHVIVASIAFTRIIPHHGNNFFWLLVLALSNDFNADSLSFDFPFPPSDPCPFPPFKMSLGVDSSPPLPHYPWRLRPFQILYGKYTLLNLFNFFLRRSLNLVKFGLFLNGSSFKRLSLISTWSSAS